MVEDALGNFRGDAAAGIRYFDGDVRPFRQARGHARVLRVHVEVLRGDVNVFGERLDGVTVTT